MYLYFFTCSILDAAIRLSELTRAVETSVCDADSESAAFSQARVLSPSVPTLSSNAIPSTSIRDQNSSRTGSAQLLASLGRFAEEQRAKFGRASAAFSSELHPAFTERSTAELLEPHIGCVLALSAPFVHRRVDADDPDLFSDSLSDQSADGTGPGSRERDEGTFSVIQKHDPREFARTFVQSATGNSEVETHTGDIDASSSSGAAAAVSAAPPSDQSSARVRRTPGGVLIEVSESATAGIQAGGTSSCGTNTNDLLRRPAAFGHSGAADEREHVAQSSQAACVSDASAAPLAPSLSNAQLGNALARMQREMGLTLTLPPAAVSATAASTRGAPVAGPDFVPAASHVSSRHVDTSGAPADGLENRPEREQLERSLASVRRVLRV